MSTEDKLVKKAKKGETEAFGKLYDKHFSSIYRFVFLQIRHKSDAEDITQQVFLSAWQSVGRYRTRKNIPFSSWLYKIAKNAVIDHHRTKKEYIDIEMVAEKAFADTPELGKAIDDSSIFYIVKQSLNQLNNDEQGVLIMKFINELSNKEVGQILNKSEGAIRVIQHRALKKLKQHFNG